MKSAEWPARTAWCSRFLVSMVLPSPWEATRTTFSPFAMKSSEKTRSNGRPVQERRPGPFEVREGQLRATIPDRVLERVRDPGVVRAVITEILTAHFFVTACWCVGSRSQVLRG